MRDLFSEDHQMLAIPIEDGELFYQADFLDEITAQALMADLLASVPWRSDDIVVWGKTYRQPRLTAWYGNVGMDYTYSGIHMTPLPWTQSLLALKAKVEQATRAQFNSVLINYYRDQHDSMGLHSDDELALGVRPVIASVSLGQTRSMVFKHRHHTRMPSRKVCLTSGSLLVMKGDLQAHWQHGIYKEKNPLGPRINLTFRQIQSFIQ
jgi:alkylated DNA repair dioxygenase AlkB